MFTIERCVGCSQTGPDGLLSLGAAIDFMQDCSSFQIDSEKELSAYFKKNRYGMYLTSRQVDILRRPAYGARLTVRTWVYELNSLFGFRNTTLCDEDGTLCMACYAMGAFVDLTSAKTVRMPQELIDTILIEDRLPMEYLPRRIKIPRLIPARMPEFRVPRAYIDMNRHMNNSKYITRAAEYLPADFEIGRLRIEYKIPAKAEESIRPELYRPEEGGIVLVSLNGEDGSPRAIVEFTEKGLLKDHG